ncbi:MAG: FISUMP domain-containing protein, partial [Flavobacteriales bacterium]
MRIPTIFTSAFFLFVLLFPGAASGQESALWNPDADGDGCVTMSDVLSLISVFTACSDWGVMDGPDSADSVPWNPDANGDGCVTMTDLLSLMGVFTLCSDWGAVDGPDSPALSCVDSVDFDGHVYETVLIGDQCWFAENLRTTVYANGDQIPAGLTGGEWVSATAGATAVYGEGTSTCYNYWSPDIDACDEAQSLAAYGRLYNWYAVDDGRGLCPSGWHVPTDGEWTDLEDFITSQGFAGTEGTALKSTSGWYNNGNGTDDFGFSALPGGYRYGYDGYFPTAGFDGSWWSSSLSGIFALNRYLNYNSPDVDLDVNGPRNGYSVRCLKDAVVNGCTDPAYTEYDASANTDDG